MLEASNFRTPSDNRIPAPGTPLPLKSNLPGLPIYHLDGWAIPVTMVDTAVTAPVLSGEWLNGKEAIDNTLSSLCLLSVDGS
jgi:hypothetical protein